MKAIVTNRFFSEFEKSYQKRNEMKTETQPLGTRASAMKWWNESPPEEKCYLSKKWFVRKHYSNLTGREIEIIYLEETK
jgi:hypothetical protein